MESSSMQSCPVCSESRYVFNSVREKLGDRTIAELLQEMDIQENRDKPYICCACVADLEQRVNCPEAAGDSSVEEEPPNAHRTCSADTVIMRSSDESSGSDIIVEMAEDYSTPDHVRTDSDEEIVFFITLYDSPPFYNQYADDDETDANDQL